MAGKKQSETGGAVKRRKVFYIPGYDPMLPRRYRELYRSESAKQATVTGYEIDLKGKTSGGPYGWTVTSKIDEQQTETDFEFLQWSDIVRTSMDASIAGTYLLLARTAWTYFSTGALPRLMRLRKGPVIAAFYPVVMLLGQMLISLAAGALLAASIAVFAPLLIGIGLGAGMFGLLMHWFKSKDAKLFVYYLMHDYAFTARHRGANPEALEARMADFTDRISAALAQKYDEVLVVGHSSGAHLAVSILSDILRQGRAISSKTSLGFLSLGQVIPMVSFLPEAHRLRADLAYLCQREELTWVDVSAPGDGCTFALCDPVSVSGAAPDAGKRWPLVISAAFTQTLSNELYTALKWRFFRLHFQYLCAFDKPGDYDYFQITAGPRTLQARYAGRLPSKSRIETALAPHKSLVAA